MQDPTSPPVEAPYQQKVVRATLWAGLFTNGVWDMLSVLVPLYAAGMGMSAADIGFIVAARSLLPSLLSIHGGIVMDYWGTPRVLGWVAVACLVLPLLYPLSGLFALLLALQLIVGLASSLGMSASQTWSLQISQDVATLAKYSLYSRIGTFLGPVIVGAAWDFLGAWAAFGCISLWAAGTVATAGIERRRAARISPAQPRSALMLIPQWRAHKDALALAVIPGVAFVLLVSFFRNAPGAIQSSMYIVYLGNIGLTGTLIGILIGVCELAGIFGSLLAASTERLIRPHALVIVCMMVSAVAISVTPLIGFLVPLLFVATSIRGFAQGMSQPLMYSLLGKAVPPTVHGASVGLRNAVTRLASIVTPAVMGIAAEAWGIETSFYVMGGVLLLGLCALAVAAHWFARSA